LLLECNAHFLLDIRYGTHLRPATSKLSQFFYSVKSELLSWSGARTPDAAGPVTCAVTRNVRSARYPVDIRLLEIETEIAFLEIENRDSFLLRVHSFH
jgi:hypothetical protein